MAGNIFSRIIESISKYIRSVSKDRYIEKLEIYDYFYKETEQSVNVLTAYLKSERFLSKETKALYDYLMKSLGLRSGDHDGLEKLIKTYHNNVDRFIPKLTDLITDELPEKVDPAAMTAKEAAIVGLVDDIAGVEVSLFDTIMAIITLEVDEANRRKQSVPPARIRELYRLVPRIGKFILSFNDKSTKLYDEIKSLPDVEVSNESVNDYIISKATRRTPALVSVLASINLLVPTPHKIGFFIVEAIKTYQEFLKTRLQYAEIRLQELRDYQNGEQSDPRLEKQIEYYEKRIAELEHKIRSLEPDDD